MGDKKALKLNLGKVVGIGFLLGIIFFIIDVVYKQMMFDTSINLYFQYPSYALGAIVGYGILGSLIVLVISLIYNRMKKV